MKNGVNISIDLINVFLRNKIIFPLTYGILAISLKPINANYVYKREQSSSHTVFITQWFTMMNVKDKYAAVRLRKKKGRSAWTLKSENFVLLETICNVIDSCRFLSFLFTSYKSKFFDIYLMDVFFDY